MILEDQLKKNLETFYQELNFKFFNNKLDKVPIYLGYVPYNRFVCSCEIDQIVIHKSLFDPDSKLFKGDKYIIDSLLHAMIHISCGDAYVRERHFSRKSSHNSASWCLELNRLKNLLNSRDFIASPIKMKRITNFKKYGTLFSSKSIELPQDFIPEIGESYENMIARTTKIGFLSKIELQNFPFSIRDENYYNKEETNMIVSKFSKLNIIDDEFVIVNSCDLSTNKWSNLMKTKYSEYEYATPEEVSDYFKNNEYCLPEKPIHSQIFKNKSGRFVTTTKKGVLCPEEIGMTNAGNPKHGGIAIGTDGKTLLRKYLNSDVPKYWPVILRKKPEYRI